MEEREKDKKQKNNKHLLPLTSSPPNSEGLKGLMGLILTGEPVGGSTHVGPELYKNNIKQTESDRNKPQTDTRFPRRDSSMEVEEGKKKEKKKKKIRC